MTEARRGGPLALLALVLFLTPLLAAGPEPATAPMWGAPLLPALLSVWSFPDWAAILGILVLTAAAWQSFGPAAPASPPLARRTSLAFLVLLGLACLSAAVHLALASPAYAGPMLRSLLVGGVQFTVFTLTRRMAQTSRKEALLLLFAVIFASTVASAVGLREFLEHVRIGQKEWRVFGTSSPDFLAASLALILPVTLALFLSARSFLLTILFALAGAMETIVLLTTQSRFALISLAVSLIVFGISLIAARKRGLEWERSVKARLGLVLGLAVVAGGLAAKPVLNRLHQTGTGDNSTAFRLLTWRGTGRMIAANPVLGTGPGTYVHRYPRYALTGFTRHAHEGYLQMAAECGVPSLLALLSVLGFGGAALWRGLARPLPAPEEDDSTPADDRWLLCGLLAGITAGAVQNLADTDWAVFGFGTTFWALLGLGLGIAARSDSAPAPLPTPRLFRLLTAGAASLAAILLLTQGVAAWFGQNADTAASPEEAERDYQIARTWNPLNAQYPAYLGYRVYFAKANNAQAAIDTLQSAVRLEPSGLNCASLGRVYYAAGRPDDAVRTLQQGLKADPNSIDIRMSLSQILAKTDPAQALAYAQQIADLELSPVGQVRALGGVTEYKFAIADAQVAQAASRRGDSQTAIQYYARAARVLEAYADEGGTTAEMRQVTLGNHMNPSLDDMLHTLYKQVMSDWIRLAAPAERASLTQRAAHYEDVFQKIYAVSSQTPPAP